VHRFIARRLLVALPILFGVSVVTFLFANLAPGDPLSTLARPGEGTRPSDLAALRTSLGLDQPLYIRYLTWLGQVVQGNFGASLIRDTPVTKLLLTHIPNSLLLMGIALTLSVILGTLLGVISAFRQYSWLDRGLTFVALSGIAVPSYLLAIFVVYLFAVVLGLLPPSGMQSAAGAADPLMDRVRHLILPVGVLTFGNTAIFMRYARSSVLDVMRQDYVTTARAKGLRDLLVRRRHILRNALLPIVTIVGLCLPNLITGALFVETIFSWPGIAKAAVDASLERDYPVIMGVALVTSVAIIASNLIADVAYAVVDPRIRHE
jgi:peptide/nickel transport system permease protein